MKSQLMPLLPTAGSAGQDFSSGLQTVEVCAEAVRAAARATEAATKDLDNMVE